MSTSSTELPLIEQAVEKLRWHPLSPEIGYQTRRFWNVSSPISGRYQPDTDFFNRLRVSANFALTAFSEVRLYGILGNPLSDI
jgi:hypothetical protein